MENVAQRAPSERRPLLDGFRGLAILLVIYHHALAAPDDPTASLVERAATALARDAWVGVDCFFVLSGFLITGILVDTRERAHATRNFLARRALRTFPLYYAVVFVCLVVLPPVIGPGFLRDLSGRQLWFWLHASNFYSVLHNILASDGPPVGWMSTFWSLSVEEHFYLGWALVAAAVAPARLGLAAGLGLAGTLACRVALLSSGYGGAIYRSSFTRLDGLLMGALLALAVRRRPDLGRGVVLAPLVATLAFAAFLVLEEEGFVGQTIRFSLGALGFASVLVLALRAEQRPDSLLHRVLSSRVLTACGRTSYAMYMFNKPILMGIHQVFLRTRLPLVIGFGPTMVAYVVLAMVLSYAAALISWHAFEKHFLKLKRYF